MIEIGDFTERDWHSVQSIYQQGMDTKNATFEEKAPEWNEWNAVHKQNCRLVAKSDHTVIGWAALSPVSSRSVYAGVAEISIYIRTDNQGRGVGKKLLSAIVKASEDKGYWTLQARIFPENIASIEIHNKCGFRILGRHEKMGRLDGHWRDVVLLERRSKIIGW